MSDPTIFPLPSPFFPLPFDRTVLFSFRSFDIGLSPGDPTVCNFVPWAVPGPSLGPRRALLVVCWLVGCLFAPLEKPYKTNGFDHMARSGPILDARMAPDAPHMSPDDFPDGSYDPQMGPNVPRVTPRWVQINSNEPQICRNDARMTPT